VGQPSAEKTREEDQALELDREAVYREGVQALLARFSELPQDLKEALRERWTVVKIR